jgi:hypothetical protein
MRSEVAMTCRAHNALFGSFWTDSPNKLLMIGSRLRGVAQLLIWGLMLTLQVICDGRNPGSKTNRILKGNDGAGREDFTYVSYRLGGLISPAHEK